MDRHTDDEIAEILESNRKITVVGLSPNPARPSHGVTAYMIRRGYDVVGVHPAQSEILGRPVYPSLKEAPRPLGIVDVFRSPSAIPALVDEAIAEGVKILWLQEGVTHPEAEEKARRAGIQVVSDRCILKEHRRLIAGRKRAASG